VTRDVTRASGLAQAFVSKWISSFKQFPPRRKAASFSVDQALEKLSDPKSR